MIHFVVNPAGGKNRSRKILKKVSAYLDVRGVPYDISYTEKEKGAAPIAKSLTVPGSGLKKVVVIGGDGTFSQFLGGIDDFSTIELGLLAGGTGNDFARAAGLSTDYIKEMDKILSGGQKRKIDFIEADGKRSLNVAGTGLDVQVLLQKYKYKAKGKLGYLRALIKVLMNFETYKLAVEIDGQTLIRDCLMAGVCNGTCIGGGMHLSPRSDISDGLLNVVIVSMPKNGRVLPVLPKFLKGKHIDMDFTEEFLVEKVKVYGAEKPIPVQLDGEIFEDTVLDCVIIKDKLTLLN